MFKDKLSNEFVIEEWALINLIKNKSYFIEISEDIINNLNLKIENDLLNTLKTLFIQDYYIYLDINNKKYEIFIVIYNLNNEILYQKTLEIDSIEKLIKAITNKYDIDYDENSMDITIKNVILSKEASSAFLFSLLNHEFNNLSSVLLFLKGLSINI